MPAGDTFSDEGHPEPKAEISDDIAAGGFHAGGLTGRVVLAVEGVAGHLDLFAFFVGEVNSRAGSGVWVPDHRPYPPGSVRPAATT